VPAQGAILKTRNDKETCHNANENCQKICGGGYDLSRNMEREVASMPLRNRLKEYRARIDVNQSEFGKMVGVSRQTISQIERGDYSPSVTLALKIARCFDAKVEDIFIHEED